MKYYGSRHYCPWAMSMLIMMTLMLMWIMLRLMIICKISFFLSHRKNIPWGSASKCVFMCSKKRKCFGTPHQSAFSYIFMFPKISKCLGTPH